MRFDKDKRETTLTLKYKFVTSMRAPKPPPRHLQMSTVHSRIRITANHCELRRDM